MKPNTVGFTAVLADDEELILKRLEESVNWEELNIRLVSLAQNGKQALEAILTFKPDLAVIDIRMPEISGLEVIQRSRNAGIQTDFIILSGYDDFSYAQEAIRYGARAYLLKPVNSSELYDEIYRICLEHSRRKGPRISPLYQNKLNVSFFNKLIDSKILEPGIIQQILSSTELNISDSPCYVCVIQFDDDIPKKKPPLSADELTAALDRHFAHEKHVFWNYNARQVVGIFNISSTLPFQNAMGCLEVIRSLNLSPPVIGIGDTVSGLMECPYSYNRALTAMTYQLYDDTSRIFTSESICTIPPTLKLSDIDYLPLIQFIVKKDLEGIRTYCNDFMNRLLYVPAPPPNYVFSFCYALFHQVEKEFSDFSHNEITEIATAQDLYRFRKLSQIRRWLIDSFCQLSEFIDAVYGYATPKYSQAQKTAVESDDDLIRSAKEFIHSNITNHIKIEDIARHVHLSPSYFAIYFKNKTDVNLRDYLLAEKMEYARRALMNPDTSIRDVAYDVGYGDYRSFSRAFKNVHGITPSDFQSKYR